MTYPYNEKVQKLVEDITEAKIDYGNPFSIRNHELSKLQRSGNLSYLLPDGTLPPYKDFLIRSHTGIVADDKDFDFNIYETLLAKFLNPWFQVGYDEFYKPFKDDGVEFTDSRRKTLKDFDPTKKKQGFLYGNFDSWGFSDTKVLEIIYHFLQNIYQNESFVSGMNCQLYNELLEDIKKDESRARCRFESLNKTMYTIVRELLIEYMGFHGIWILSNNCDAGIYQKAIFTSEINAVELFYNFILNDFIIIKCPKMMWDKETKRYERYDERLFPFVQTKEELLMKEAVATKKLVPKSDLYKYYR